MVLIGYNELNHTPSLTILQLTPYMVNIEL